MKLGVCNLIPDGPCKKGLNARGAQCKGCGNSLCVSHPLSLPTLLCSVKSSQNPPNIVDWRLKKRRIQQNVDIWCAAEFFRHRSDEKIVAKTRIKPAVDKLKDQDSREEEENWKIGTFVGPFHPATSHFYNHHSLIFTTSTYFDVFRYRGFDFFPSHLLKVGFLRRLSLPCQPSSGLERKREATDSGWCMVVDFHWGFSGLDFGLNSTTYIFVWRKLHLGFRKTERASRNSFNFTILY